MSRIERLRDDHAPALLAFEQENREYFARSVPDRGDAFFAEFASRHLARLAEQDAGECHFHVILDNPASMTVLARNGFTPVGDITLSGRPGVRYGRRLAAVC